MLPGVELARRRRVHYHGDTASSSASSAGAAEYHHHHYAHAHRHVGAAADAAVVGPVMAARLRLEEKLRGAALPSSAATSPSRSVCTSSLLCFHLPSPVFHAFVGDSGGRYVSSELVADPNQNQAIGGQEQERLLNALIFSCTPRCRSRITLSILCFAEEENHSVLTEI
jgi:hypothetical protein